MGKKPRVKLRGPTGLAAVGVLLTLIFGHLLGPFDLLTFLHAGRDVLHGRTPYAAPDSPVFRSGHAFVYPLYVAWLFAPLAALPRGVAEVVYGVGSLGAIVASCRLLGRARWGTAGLVLVSSTTIIGLQMGTLNAFLLLGIACAWHWRDTRPALAGVLLGAAATAKLFLLPVLLWPLLRRRLGLAASAMGTVVGLMLASAALGSLSPVAYVQMMSRLDARERVTSWSLSSFLQGLGAGRGWATAGSVLVVAVVVGMLFRWRSRLGDGRLLGAAVVCSLLLSPILWSSYLLLLAVPLLLSGRDRLVAVFALASWAVVTPDAASTSRVMAGLAVAVLVALAVVGPRPAVRLPSARRPDRRPAHPLLPDRRPPHPVLASRRQALSVLASGRQPLSVLASRPQARSVLPTRRQLLSALPVPAAFAGLMAVLPASARSPFPALFVTGLVAARCLRPVERGEALEPS